MESSAGPPAPIIDLPPEPCDPFDRTSQRSLINLVPATAQAAFLNAARLRPDLMGVDEHTLAKILRSEEATPTPTANRLRLKFWAEYDRAMFEGGKMKIDHIHNGVCHASHWYKWLAQPTFAAWILCPPANYMVKMEEALEFGIEQMRDILSLDHTGNVKLMDLKARITSMLKDAVKGPAVQRIEQRNLSVHVQATEKTVAGQMQRLNEADIDKRIKELEARDRHAKRLNERAKVEVVDAE